MNKKISIILSTYNEAYIIDDTIKKILTNIENVEIVIVDDNSSDGTCDIIDKINNPKIKLFRRSGRGLSSAFLPPNIAPDSSFGQIYVAFNQDIPSGVYCSRARLKYLNCFGNIPSSSPKNIR